MGVAVVTGASTGIGLATACRLASDGHDVHAGARDPDGAAVLWDAIAETPGTIQVLRLDVDDDDSVALALREVERRSGPVDVLVNNAGVSGSGTVEDTPIDEFRRQMETNLFGVLRCTKAVLPSMRERGQGCIVNVGSLAGRFVRPAMGAYSASKHALEGLTDALAQEVAPFGVRVAIVEPGVVATPIWSKSAPPPPDSPYTLATEKALAYYARMLQQPTPPEAVAGVVADVVSGADTRFRVVVGWDAEAILAARPSISDEDLLAMAALPVDRWKAAWAEAFGFPLE